MHGSQMVLGVVMSCLKPSLGLTQVVPSGGDVNRKGTSVLFSAGVRHLKGSVCLSLCQYLCISVALCMSHSESVCLSL